MAGEAEVPCWSEEVGEVHTDIQVDKCAVFYFTSTAIRDKLCCFSHFLNEKRRIFKRSQAVLAALGTHMAAILGISVMGKTK